MTAPAPWIEVAAGVVFREKKILISQRRSEDHLGGLWEFPGGKLEQGESWEDCLHRELREELAVEVAVDELLFETRHEYPAKRILIRFYRCQWLRHEPQALGCARFIWIGREELKDYAFPPADEPLVRLLTRAELLWK